MVEHTFDFEIYKEKEGDQYYLVIGTENGSGVQYRVKDYKEVGEKISQYLETYYSED
jgi:hypothetical protein